MRGVIAAGVIAGSLVCARDAAAVCRVVEEPDTPPPEIEPDQSLLVTRRTNVVIGEECTTPPGDPGDAGVPDDAGTPGDGGEACTPVYGDTVSMVVQPRFAAQEGSRFALLMVTPSNPVIATERTDLFAELDTLTAQIVEVEPVCIEDASLGYQCNDPKGADFDLCPWSWDGGYVGDDGEGGFEADTSFGCGGGAVYAAGDDDDSWASDAGDSWGEADAGVPVLETIGPYEVVRLPVATTEELAGWLETFGYLYNQQDLAAVEPYLSLGWTVVAVRVAVGADHDGGLEPMSLTWVGTEMRLPLAISRVDSIIPTHLRVYLAGDGRYELGAGRVAWAHPTTVGGGTFLTRVDLDHIPTDGPDLDPVAARAAADTSVDNIVTVTQEVHIPSSECPGYDDDPGPRPSHHDDGGCCDGGGRTLRGPVNLGLVLFAAAVALRPRRRRRRRPQ